MVQKICKKCCQSIYKKDLIACQDCKNSFHTQCVDINKSKVKSKTNSKSVEWKCTVCITKQRRSSVISHKTRTSTPHSDQGKQTKVSEEPATAIMSPSEIQPFEQKLSQLPLSSSNTVLCRANTSDEIQSLGLGPSTSDQQQSPIDSDTDGQTYANSSKVTLRRKLEFRKNKSDLDKPNNDSDSINLSSVSLPNERTRQNSSIVEDLHTEIELLKEQLQSANNEIENLNLENVCLKKLVEQYELKLKIYKSVRIDDFNISSKSAKEQLYHKRNKTVSSDSFSEHRSREKTLQRAASLPDDSNSETLNNQNTTSPAKLNKIADERDLHSNSTGNKNESFTKSSTEQQIFILGDQQASGLAMKLRDTRKERQNRWNDVYNISSIIKPNASCEEVLKHCDVLQSKLTMKDRVVLLLGANDKNPNTILGELSCALKKLRNTKVYIIPTMHNPYLNVNLLNNSIAGLTQSYDNCQHILLKNYNLDKSRLMKICYSINFNVDYGDYKNMYLTLNNPNNVIRKRLTAINSTKISNSKQTYKKGTIPYFFNIMTNKLSIKDQKPESNKRKTQQAEFFRAQ